LRTKDSPTLRKVQQLLGLRGIGVNSVWLYVHEFFGWRKFKNRREVVQKPHPAQSVSTCHKPTQGLGIWGKRYHWAHPVVCDFSWRFDSSGWRWGGVGSRMFGDGWFR
jgi:hypothetical protein